MAVLEPELCIMMSLTPDWISDALKIVAEGVSALRDDKRALLS